MRTCVQIAAMWFCLCDPALAQAQETRLLDPFDQPVGLGIESYHAVLFAAQDYRDDSLDLKSPLHDIGAVGAVLRDQYGFHIDAVPNATRSEVLQKLAALSDLPASAAVVVYFSGHGYFDEVEGRGYWLPIDARRDDPAREGWVSSDDVLAKLRKVAAAHVLIVADSCFSGKFFDNRDSRSRSGPQTAAAARELAAKGSRWWISAGGNEPVPDSGGCDGMSVFSCAFAELLRASTEYYVVPDALFVNLRQRVETNSHGAQTPAQGPLPGNPFGQMVFLNQRACSENVKQRAQLWEDEAHRAWERVRAAPTAAAIGQWLDDWGAARPFAACGDELTWQARDALYSWVSLQAHSRWEARVRKKAVTRRSCCTP